MIIKSNASVKTDSTEINHLANLLEGLDLPAGARLARIDESIAPVGVEGTELVSTYTLIFEWEEER